MVRHLLFAPAHHPPLHQADVTIYCVDTKSQVGIMLKGTNPPSSDFRQGDKTLITEQLMP